MVDKDILENYGEELTAALEESIITGTAFISINSKLEFKHVPFKELYAVIKSINNQLIESLKLKEIDPEITGE